MKYPNHLFTLFKPSRGSAARAGRITVAAAGLLLAGAALAAGTPSGTPVVNSVTLDYSVNGGAQPQLTDAITFNVDSRLAVDVTALETEWVSVTVGQQFAGTGIPAANYEVTNGSNLTTDLVVGIIDQNGIQVTDFDTTIGSPFSGVTVNLAVDDGSTDPDNRLYDHSDDTLLTPNANGYYDLSGIAADEIVNLMIVIDVPLGLADTDVASYTLVAAVATAPATPYPADESGNVAPNSGAPVNNAPNTLAGIETVFADTGSADAEDDQFDFFVAFAGIAASQDIDSDGQNADTNGFRVAVTDLYVGKYVEVLYDPINGNKYVGGVPAAPAVEPKAIPGAVLMYVIGIANNDAVFVAENVVVDDDIPDNLIGEVEPVDEGNQSGSAVNLPDNVDVDVDPGPGVDIRNFDLTTIADLDSIFMNDCAGADSTTAYHTDVLVGPDTDVTNSEISVAVGQCDPAEEAHLVYFVTVETN